MRESLADSYRRCQALHRRYGRTYYLATGLLPAWKRRHVHALYWFTRYADEIVDAPGGATPAQRAARLEAWGAAFRAGDLDHPLLPAVLHSAPRAARSTPPGGRTNSVFPMNLSSR